MPKLDETGIYQLDNGMWGFRFVTMRNGKRIERKKASDANGNKLPTKTAAVRARKAAIEALQKELESHPPELYKATCKDVFEEYCEKGRKGKAYTTILKQDSLWKNYIRDAFGNRYVNDISVAEINDYLAHLYFDEGKSFGYVESFLKVFYLIFGQAYSRNYLDGEAYNKLCVNKDTKIHMPQKRVEEDDDVATFTHEQLAALDAFFRGKSCETAYLLGKFCGLRINETYGLKWDHVDFEKGTICIDRQMQYQEGIIKLVPPKTRNAKRTIYMNDKLRAFLKEKQDEMKLEKYQKLQKQNARTIEDLDGSLILATELVNCLPNGRLQTRFSFKYPTRNIKKECGFQFKYHYLRHTYGTIMAELNTPAHLLCKQMGHGNIKVTQRYYLGISDTGVEALLKNLNQL